MILWIPIIALLILYFIDFKLAMKIAKKDLLLFEKVEQNKGLVYAVMKDIIERSNKNIILMHVNNVVDWTIGSLLFWGIGYYLFSLSWQISVGLVLIAKAVGYLIGIISDLIALFKLRNHKVNLNEKAGVKVPSYAG